MTHLLVIEYPYFSVKKLFTSVNDAKNYEHSFVNKQGYFWTALTKRVFELENFNNKDSYSVRKENCLTIKLNVI